PGFRLHVAHPALASPWLPTGRDTLAGSGLGRAVPGRRRPASAFDQILRSLRPGSGGLLGFGRRPRLLLTALALVGGRSGFGLRPVRQHGDGERGVAALSDGERESPQVA